MAEKKPKASKKEPKILSQCPECLGIEMQYGDNTYNVKTRPSMVLLKDTASKLCPRCVAKFQIE